MLSSGAQAGPWLTVYQTQWLLLLQDVAELYKDQPFDLSIDCMGSRSEWGLPACPRARF